jgi:conjugal transfer pilin signal peptidase TrbI
MSATLQSKSGVLRVGRSALYVINTLIVLFLMWIAAVKFADFPYRLGIDGQKVRCLPWSVFLVKQQLPESIRAGDLIQFRAGQVGHGFDGLVFVKMVAAVPGDQVEIRGNQLFINGKLREQLWLLKALQQKPGDLDITYVVPKGEYLMLGTTRESFDGRYWGTVKQEQLLGSARPLF